MEQHQHHSIQQPATNKGFYGNIIERAAVDEVSTASSPPSMFAIWLICDKVMRGEWWACVSLFNYTYVHDLCTSVLVNMMDDGWSSALCSVRIPMDTRFKLRLCKRISFRCGRWRTINDRQSVWRGNRVLVYARCVSECGGSVWRSHIIMCTR